MTKDKNKSVELMSPLKTPRLLLWYPLPALISPRRENILKSPDLFENPGTTQGPEDTSVIKARRIQVQQTNYGERRQRNNNWGHLEASTSQQKSKKNSVRCKIIIMLTQKHGSHLKGRPWPRNTHTIPHGKSFHTFHSRRTGEGQSWRPLSRLQ